MSDLRRRLRVASPSPAGGPTDKTKVQSDEDRREKSTQEKPLSAVAQSKVDRLSAASSFVLPPTAVGIILLAFSRVLAAALSMISDCDETFNYWEPMHFIAFGRGFQTWEYSPAFALRSYLFLLPHAATAKAFAAVSGRPAAFFLTRGVQACCAVAAETAFVLAVRRRLGDEVARVTAVLLATSPGMWSAAVAFLPSSVAMILTCFIWALWLSERLGPAIFLGVGVVVVVWPFTGLLFVPFGLHALATGGFVRGMATAIVSVVVWSMASLLVDSSFYGRPVIPALEILRYNVFGKSTGSGGAELYGVEPWYFYIINAALNLTAALPAAAVLPIVAALAWLCHYRSRERGDVQRQSSEVICSALGFCGAGFLWFAFFSCIGHKEERFLAPAYPVLILAAASTVCGATQLLLQGVPGFMRRLISSLPLLFLFATTLLSVSRIFAVQTGYSAPLDIYSSLSRELSVARASHAHVSGTTVVATTKPIHVCIGAEWYRFTTSFFLPHMEDHFSYIRFGPTGLLPAEWNRDLGTSGMPPHMNDRNEEEVSRYIDPEKCDYLVDLILGDGEGDIPRLRKGSWDIVKEVPFLDASRSKQPWRSFFVPGVSSKRVVYAPYRLLRRRRS
eukprot:TRINITY_DN54463_c0_g1_i1.p1 TRINITY_DN54463_c0_g1~~TRINITY_DN54463_c0_g1_i1.p1  ORF type:complete len:637 (-),score=95.83 TRINITY_DN54463_c0_g1_i1:100-1956(-)